LILRLLLLGLLLLRTCVRQVCHWRATTRPLCTCARSSICYVFHAICGGFLLLLLARQCINYGCCAAAALAVIKCCRCLQNPLLLLSLQPQLEILRSPLSLT